jgi:hypothetical protein
MAIFNSYVTNYQEGYLKPTTSTKDSKNMAIYSEFSH